MIGRLNHVAIAVRDMAAAVAVYRDTLGGEVSEKVAQPEHGVSTVFVVLPNTKIELLEPLGANSPIAKFLERNADGGIHHICYEVDDIIAARDRLKAAGARVATAKLDGDNRADILAGTAFSDVDLIYGESVRLDPDPTPGGVVRVFNGYADAVYVG